MRIWKFVSLILPLAAVLSAAPQKGGGQQAQRMAQELGLNDDQKAKIQPILAEEAGKLKALRADTTLSNRDRRQKMLALRDDYDKQLKPILTEDQFKKMQELRAERRQQARKRVRN
ncbi:MAG: hypothetical protein QM757_43760 [Paludibaculum sp.]